MGRDSEDKIERGSPMPTPDRTSDETKDDRGIPIGDSLRHIYDDVLSEPVPESIHELLRKLG